MWKILFISIITIVSMRMKAQDTCFVNPSLEGPSQAHVVPAPWTACFGSPDTQPGQWGITQAPSNGTSYVSILHDGLNSTGYTEGFSEILNTTLTPNVPYSFSFDLAHSNIYNTASPGNCYSSLQIWGGNTTCSRLQLLWQSGAVIDTNWQTYYASFIPTSAWDYITFEPYVITGCSGYINCMIDNISCLTTGAGNVTGVNPLCATSCNGSATANFLSGTPPFTYLWSPGNQTTQSITGLCQGMYYCTMTDSLSQTFTGSVYINAPSPITVSTGSNGYTCFGLCTGLINGSASGGTGNLSFLWSPGNSTTTGISALCGGIYTITVTDANGCTSSSIDTIVTNPQIFSTTMGSTIDCFGDCDGTGNVLGTGGTGTLSYFWMPGFFPNTSPINLCAGVYFITITDALGCTTTDTAMVSGPPETIYSVLTTPTCATPSGAAQVNISSGDGPFTYFWFPFGGNNSTAFGLPAGNYTVTVTDSNGCTFDTPFIIGPDTTSFNINSSLTIVFGDNAFLLAGGGGTYSWTPSDQLSCTTCSNPVANPTITTEYCVTITTIYGCSDTKCTTVFVENPCPNNPEFETPNAFSPNGDGNNDIFLFQGLDRCAENFLLTVYDRWGELVFETTNTTFGWNGTFNGQNAQTGVYTYFLYVDMIGSEINYVTKGNVTLLR